MNFSISETENMVGQMAKDFAEKNIRPYVMEWDEAQKFPVETMKAMGELGLLGVLVPEEYGGAGFGYHEYVRAIIEITKDPSRILFANPCKMSSQIRYARANDVDYMTFDCEEELYKIRVFDDGNQQYHKIHEHIR